MGWKDLPNWIKGALIGIAISILFIIHRATTECIASTGGLLGNCNSLNSLLANLEAIPFFIFMILLSIILSPFVDSLPFDIWGSGSIFWVEFILSIILFFGIIGAIIGWIYGKIKSK